MKAKKTITQILSLVIEHSRIIYNVVSEMGVYYKSWREDPEANKTDLEKKKSKLQMLEEDADAIKIRLIKEFSEAGTQGLGNYMTLILRMDNVINSALEFVDILSKIHDGNEFNEHIETRYEKLINKLLKMTDILKLAIKNLQNKPQLVFENTTSIHELENEIDLIFRDFLDYLYDNNNLEIRLVLRVRDSIKVLEELADRIHDIGDLLRVIRYS
ncbi:MAG: hypothetical protein BAJALOKI1v1_490005 [Promethearchaeota archaeon]|nr:MAG: hypothetical protein BAJALOKI1v1_490005 [Candidatus Lokiarchaeota archaeon]